MTSRVPGAATNDVEFQGVSKRYGEVTAVSGIDLGVPKGAFVALLGPSGCGKTTCLRMIGGFEQPSEGTVLIDGEPMNGVPAYRRPVNMVFQHYALFPHLDVQANVSYGLRQRRPRIDRREIDRRTIEALELVRLGGFAARRIHEMSGGQQQRVALARAIVNRPSVLLLDEPLAALDKKLRTAMQIELQNLQRELGITFVLVTHDQEEALSMSDLVCVMNAGRIEPDRATAGDLRSPGRPVRRRLRRQDQPHRRHRRSRRRFAASGRRTGATGSNARAPGGSDCGAAAEAIHIARGDRSDGFAGYSHAPHLSWRFRGIRDRRATGWATSWSRLTGSAARQHDRSGRPGDAQLRPGEPAHISADRRINQTKKGERA